MAKAVLAVTKAKARNGPFSPSESHERDELDPVAAFASTDRVDADFTRPERPACSELHHGGRDIGPAFRP
jgi:hypothetical protein